MHAGLGVGLGGFGQAWTHMGKRGQKWAGLDGQTDQEETGDMASGYVWVSVRFYGWLWASLGIYGQRCAGLDGSD